MNFICRLVFVSLIATVPLLQSCVAEDSGDNPITGKRDSVSVLKCDKSTEGEIVKPDDDDETRICRDGKWVVLDDEDGENEDLDLESSSSEKSSSSKRREVFLDDEEDEDDVVEDRSSSSRSIKRSSSSSSRNGVKSSSSKSVESSGASGDGHEESSGSSDIESNDDIESSAGTESSDDAETKVESSSEEPGEPEIESSSTGEPVDVIYICEDGITTVLDPENCPLMPNSSSEEIVSPVDPGSKFPSIEAYGPPPAEYTKDIFDNGKTGWSAAYWDACKPHCSWPNNVDTTSDETYKAGRTIARNCNIHDVEIPAFTLSHSVQQYWMGYEGTASACEKNNAGSAFACTDMAPIAVNEQLSYGYAAVPSIMSRFGCGKCYHLQFDGGYRDASEVIRPKQTHKALSGKHMIVMAANIGFDMYEGQFDLMVPGGGSGIFDALSMQVTRYMTEEEREEIEWGSPYGGFLSYCQMQLGYDNTLEKYQTCVKDMCDAAFGNAGLPNLLRGCHWFADWFMAADYPTYNWEEVECPQYLLDHYMSSFNTEKVNRFAWHTDWSTYKEGNPLETLDCSNDGCTCTEEMAAKGACHL